MSRFPTVPGLAAIVSLLIAAGMSAGCGEDPPSEINVGELPAPLAEALDGLRAAGYDVRVVETGPEDTPTLAVEGDDPIVVMPTGHGFGSGFTDTSGALNELWDEAVGGFTEVICGGFVVAGPAESGLRSVVRAAGKCTHASAPEGTTGIQDPNRDEPEIPRGGELCGDIEVNGEFLGFRMFTENLSCGKAKLVMAAVVDGSPPEGWSCSSGPGTLVECRKGEASVAFNE